MKVLVSTLALAALLFSQNVSVAKPIENTAIATGTASAALTEAKYDRLMKIYVNKIKLAFVQADDAQTLEILNQYAGLFMQQTDALKTELLATTKELPKAEVEALYKRLLEKSRGAEMMALLYDERVAGRMQSNPQIQKVMDAMQAKSQEIHATNLLATR